MSTKLFLSVITILLNMIFVHAQQPQQENTKRSPLYRDPAVPIRERVQDLLSRMTREEKFWQLFMLYEDMDKDKSRYTEGIFGFESGNSLPNTDAALQMINQAESGQAYDFTVRINEIQKFFMEKTRLGVPVIMFDEALHGLAREGSTAFPQAIGLAATFDTSLMHRVAGAAARETRSRGIRQVLSPVVNIANDPRWGRVEETYGEDPYLSAEMGVAFTSPVLCASTTLFL